MMLSVLLLALAGPAAIYAHPLTSRTDIDATTSTPLLSILGKVTNWFRGATERTISDFEFLEESEGQWRVEDGASHFPLKLGNPLGGWTWGENRISIVDHDPMIFFESRSAAFGARIAQTPGLLGYALPLSSFTYPCTVNRTSTVPPTIISPFDSSTTQNARTQIAEFPNLGCPKLCLYEGNRVPDKSESWLALVQRGNCSFVEKIREAMHLGARGVVVGGGPHNAEGGDQLVTMFSPDDSSDISIPASYITYASYKHLMDLIRTSTTTISGLPTVSLLMGAEETWQWPLLTLSILLLLPSIMTVITLIIHRIRQARQRRRERAPESVVAGLPTGVWTGEGVVFDGDDVAAVEKDASTSAGVKPPSGGDTEPPSLPFDLDRDPVAATELTSTEDQSASSTSSPAGSATQSPQTALVAETSESNHVRSFPLRISPTPIGPGQRTRYLKKAWFASQTECAICLGDFEKGDQLRILPCGHIFHLDEVDAWLIRRKKLCPVCKADITVLSRPASLRSPSQVNLRALAAPNNSDLLNNHRRSDDVVDETELRREDDDVLTEATPLLARRGSTSSRTSVASI